MISVRDLTVKRGGLPVLDRVSLEIGAGELVLLTGESGAGKTTLLRSLYGDLDEATGKVVVDGVTTVPQNRRRIPSLRRRMGLIFQDDRLLEDRSVYENILFALSIKSPSSLDRSRRALEILKELELSHLRSKYPSQLSAGEAQRVGIARALASSPRVVLADEPTGDLDAVTTRAIFAHLRRSWHQEGAMVVATHDLERATEAFPTARRIHLEDGRLREPMQG